MAFYDDVPMQDNAGNTHYPRTKYNSVYNANGSERLDNKLAALSSGATTATPGQMSASDKTKLDGVATNANNYAHPTTPGNKHIPSGGATGQVLKYSADGTAAWGTDNDTIYAHPNDANTRHVTDAEKSAWNAKSEKSIAITATLTVAGWSGTVAPYTQSVSVTGATTTNNILFDIGAGATATQFEAGMDAQLKATGQGVNTVTIKAFGDKPTVNIPVQFVILG